MLATYLNNGVTWTTGTPSWITNAVLSADTSADIPVVGATFRAKYSEFSAAKISLIKKATDIAATLSSWGGTSGKPSNIAGLAGWEAILNSAVTFYSLPDKPQSRGSWSNSPYYLFGDIVMYNGNGYFCISPHWSNSGTYPTYATWLWAQISQKGATQATELGDYNNIANSNVNWDYVRSLYSTYARPADGATVNNGAFANLAGAIPANILTSYIQQGTISYAYYTNWTSYVVSTLSICYFPSVGWAVQYRVGIGSYVGLAAGNNASFQLLVSGIGSFSPVTVSNPSATTGMFSSFSLEVTVTIPANTSPLLSISPTGNFNFYSAYLSIQGVKAIASLFFAKDSFGVPASKSAKNYATSLMPSAAPIRPSSSGLFRTQLLHNHFPR